MIKKPNNYESVTTGGKYKPVEVGGHYAVIKKVQEGTDKNGKQHIVVAIDFDKKDKQAGLIGQQFADDVRPDKKWPFQGLKYVFVCDYNGNDCSRDFKSFCEAAEASNGMTINWDAPDFGKQFKGKKIGVVYGNVESEYNGKVYTRPELRWWCNYDKANEQAVPKLKALKGNNASVSVPEPTPAETAALKAAEAIPDEDIPF